MWKIKDSEALKEKINHLISDERVTQSCDAQMDDGENLLYGWLSAEEAIKAIENFFDETVERSDIKDIQHEYWKYVPCRNNPGMYYPCENDTRGAIKATHVILK